MADYVSIANLALSKIGETDRLNTPDDDKHTARSIAAVWSLARQAAIRDHSWNFAMRRKGLTAEALDEAPYPWARSFPLPSESLRLIEVLGFNKREYQLEGGSVLSNSLGPVYIRYLIDEPESAKWDPLFAEAFACKLALLVGKTIAGESFNEGDAQQEYKRALSAAKRRDGLENPPVESDLSGWEEAYLGYSGAPIPGVY